MTTTVSNMKLEAQTLAALLMVAITPTFAAADTPSEGSKLFDKNCATCHGKDGRAKTLRAKFNKARDLTDPQWQDATADSAIIELIKVGRDKMPGFADKLKESQIAALAEYVRSFRPASAVEPQPQADGAQVPSPPDP